MKKTIVYTILTILPIMLFALALYYNSAQKNIPDNALKESAQTDIPLSGLISISSGDSPVDVPTPTPSPTPMKVDITLMAVGDNLLHPGIVRSGLQEDGSYDFKFEFEDISEILKISDIKIINQETPLSGNFRGFSGYPQFNSPTEVADGIADSGFNVMLAATNHAYDNGLDGLIYFADYVKETHPEILLCGIHGSEEASVSTGDAEGNEINESQKNSNPQINLLEIKGYTFAILNYTSGPNLETVPKGLDAHLDLLCPFDEKSRLLDFTKINQKVLSDIREAKEISDIVIVCPHWGTEYTPKPSKYQAAWAKEMTEAGADLIIGAHPHVVQPVEIITSDNGNTALCYYSLGNYVSTQNTKRSMYEAMAFVTFTDTGSGLAINYKRTGALGMVNHYTSHPLHFGKIYFVEEYTEELAKSHGISYWGEGALDLSDILSWDTELLGDYKLTRDEVLKP